MACVPLLVLAVRLIIQARSEAVDGFYLNNSREIQRIEHSMKVFFSGISGNVDFLASLPEVENANGALRSYTGATGNLFVTPEGRALEGLFAHLGSAYKGYSFMTLGTEDFGGHWVS